MAKVKKYWEAEEPEINVLGTNQFRYYQEAGKLQVFRVKEGTTYGVTKGVTIELDQMSDDELKELAELITGTIEKELSNRAERESNSEEDDTPKKVKKETSKTPKKPTKSKKKVRKTQSA